MKISTMLMTGATFGALALTAFPASAAVLSVAQVTVGCPDIDQARDCPVLAEEFLSTRQMSRESDGQIVSLVLAIAELSQVPRVRMPVCLNAADGLRVLAGGVSSSDQQTQINDIADALCDGTSTAAIRRGLGDLNSLSSTSAGGGAGGAGTGGGGDGGAGTGGGGDDDGGTGGGGDDDGGAGGGDDDGNNGHGNDDDHDDGSNPSDNGGQAGNGDDNGVGLGSNDASASHASANGQSHANANAVTNTHGNNGD